MIRWLAAVIVIFSVLNFSSVSAQSAFLPIGAIQGAVDISPYLNRFVNFRGVVVGRYEDENTRGDVYYTLFVQNPPEDADGDPSTSDGIAVFLGRVPRPDIPLGATVQVGGKVTEFFGLTEMDDNGLVITVEEASGPLPPPVPIDPPADMDAQATYFEALEGMRVAYEGAAVVAGPTHEGCGFAVTAEVDAGELPAIRRANDDPVGRVVPALYPSDLICDDIPQVKVGDRITGMAGALTYHFDQFKIVFDTADQLTIEPTELSAIPALPVAGPEQIIVASINAEDYFDTTRDTDAEGEPVLAPEDLLSRQLKLTYAISRLLNCPTLVAFQEIEHAALLADLSAALAEPCGFSYEVSHLDSPDERGIDNALLSDPRRTDIQNAELRRACSPVPTAVNDPQAACAAGEEPLFGRPPLQITATIDGLPYDIFVNHFKSKRGGEIETDLERIRQAVFLNGLAAEMLETDPAARIIAMGDFNDTDLSPALALLTDPAQGGRLANALAAVPDAQRYSYNFGGVVELIDAILLSPALAEEVGWATIQHANTDYPVGWRLDTSPERLPFRASDHDIPVIALGDSPPTLEPPTPEPAPTIAPITATPFPSPTMTAATEPASGSSAAIQPADTPVPEPPATDSTTTAIDTTAAKSPDNRSLVWGVLLGWAGLILVVVLVLRRHR